MKISSRSAKNVLIGIGEIIFFPFFLAFIIIFGIFLNFEYLRYKIITKFKKDATPPRIFDKIFDSFDDVYCD